MRTVKTLVFTTERDHEWLKRHEPEILASLDNVKNAKFERFEYRYADIVKPETYVDDKGKRRISQSWFDNTFTAQARQLGFDTAVFHFTRDKRTEWKLESSFNGSYLRDNDTQWEFWVCADKGQKSTQRQIDRTMSQYVRVFLHEYGHGLVHWWAPERRDDVHDYDYNKDSIKSLFTTLSAPKTQLSIDKRYAMDNYWEGNDPRSIVLHTTGGSSLEGAVQTLKARGLSYNYIIHDGIVYELVDWTKSAWHAGVKKSPNLRARSFYGNENPNRESVGIAFTYPVGDISKLEDKNVDACVKLLKYLGERTEVRYNADNIFYHQEITIDKPIIVKGYREQVLDGLVGDKDAKDAGEKTRLELMLQLLQLRLKYLLLLQSFKQK